MKAGKAHDTAGLAAEMLKVECGLLRSVILDLFNDVLISRSPPPSEWQATRLIVLFKKGGPKVPANYRPIAILPILHKLFSRMLCLRIQPEFIGNQSADQAAYRPSFSTEDHLLCTTILIERCAEWNVKLWMGLVDFEKAFNSIEHEALWQVLADQGVDDDYIDLLAVLHNNQIACVTAGANSRDFPVG